MAVLKPGYKASKLEPGFVAIRANEGVFPNEKAEIWPNLAKFRRILTSGAILTCIYVHPMPDMAIDVSKGYNSVIWTLSMADRHQNRRI